MNADGLNLGHAREREVERLFFREDFRRAQLDDIGIIKYAQDVEQRYSEAYLAHLDRKVIQDAGYTIAVDYAHSTTIDILEPLLARLNVDVVDLNTRSDSQMLSVLPEDWVRGTQLLARLVEAMELDMGARLDVSGEQVFFIDNTGQALEPALAAAAMADLIWRDYPTATLALPVHAPMMYERLAERYGGRVVRTKVDIQALMSVVSEQDIALAVDDDGHFIFSDFQPVPDGMYALARMLQCLSRHHTTLHEVVATLPSYHWIHKTVPCPWSAKGRVMRQLIEKAERYKADTTDGVKFFLDPDRWVLIRSDPDRAVMHIYAEAPSADEVERLVSGRVKRLQALVQEG